MSARHKFEALDGLRGVAALAVFVGHSPTGPLHSLFPNSYLALDLFFALSGFVLMHAYADRLQSGQMSWRQFAVARVIRLYPLFALGLALGAALAVHKVLTHAPDHDWPSLLQAAAMNFLFLPAWASGQPSNQFAYFGLQYGPFPFDHPLWSLFWELVASLVFAWLAPRLTKRLHVALLAMALASLIAVGVVYGKLDVGFLFKDFGAGALRLSYSFLIGMAVYRIWRSGRVRRLPSPTLLSFLLLVVLMAAPIGQGPHRGAVELFIVVVLFPILIFVTASSAPTGRIGWLAVQLGAASYAFYVLHVPAMMWIEALAPGFAQWQPPLIQVAVMSLVAGLIFVVSLAANYLYDVPVRRLLSRAAAGTGARRTVAESARP